MYVQAIEAVISSYERLLKLVHPAETKCQVMSRRLYRRETKIHRQGMFLSSALTQEHIIAAYRMESRCLHYGQI